MCINQPWDPSISNIFTLIHQIFSGTKPALTTHILFKEDNLLDKRKNISEKVIKEKFSINPLELNNLIKLLDSGNIKAVINRTSVLLKHCPSSDALLNILGAAYKKLGNLEEAEDKFKRAGNINPLNTNSFNNLGIILCEKGNINEDLREKFGKDVVIKKFEKPKSWISKKLSSSEESVEKIASILEERSIWQRYGF